MKVFFSITISALWSPTFIHHDKYDITISYPRHYFHLYHAIMQLQLQITSKPYFDVHKLDLDTFMLLGKLVNSLFLVLFLAPTIRLHVLWLYFESFWFWNASSLYSLQNNTLHHDIDHNRQHLS